MNVLNKIRYGLVAAVSCIIPFLFASCDDSGTSNDDETKIPSVSIEEITPQKTSVTFMLVPANAEQVYYNIVASGEALPSAENLAASGKPADALSSRAYEFTGLEPYSDYRIAAVARNTDSGFSDVVVIDFTTLVGDVVFELSPAEPTSTSVAFRLTTKYVSESWFTYSLHPEDELSAEDIVAHGNKVETEVTVIPGLHPDMEVFVHVAFKNLEGNLSTVAKISLNTLPAAEPKVGDYYYSDGSWSTELDETKTPIGLVFFAGIASEFDDRVAFYKYKDGKTSMPKVNGYAVSLLDVKDESGENEFWWSFFNTAYISTCSHNDTDFLGYSNSMSVKENADKNYGGLSNDEKNFPAFWAAMVRYETLVPAPGKSSGWFLPSVFQLKYMYDKVYFPADGDDTPKLAPVFDALGDKAEHLYKPNSDYWSSTDEVDKSGFSYWALYFGFSSNTVVPPTISSYRKNAAMNVRPVLVF